MVKTLRKIVRNLSSWAWSEEISNMESSAMIEELHAKNDGSMEVVIQQSPAKAQWVAQCFASLVAKSPNYTEMKFDIIAKGDKFEWVTVLIKKGNGRTPHELRVQAEKERDEAKAEIVRFKDDAIFADMNAIEARAEAEKLGDEVARLTGELSFERGANGPAAQWKYDSEINRQAYLREQAEIARLRDALAPLSLAVENQKAALLDYVNVDVIVGSQQEMAMLFKLDEATREVTKAAFRAIETIDVVREDKKNP